MKKILIALCLVFNIINLKISMALMYNSAIFVDEHVLTPSDITGGYFWLLMDYTRLGLMFLLILISAVLFFIDKKK